MFKNLRLMLLCLILLAFINGVNGQVKVGTSNVPKKVILLDDFITVNSQDTIFVQTIQFPLMEESQQIFISKVIADYRSPRIRQFIDAFYNRDRFKDEYYQDFSYSQNWSFEIVYQSQTEISFKLSNYEFTGGAHGNTSVKSFNIDLTNVKSYKFADKFKNLDLEKVALYSTNYCLTNKIPIFDNIIKPYPEFTKVWNFTNMGLLLTFPQYSIAPYSSGIIQIHIPNNDLKKLQKQVKSN